MGRGPKVEEAPPPVSVFRLIVQGYLRLNKLRVNAVDFVRCRHLQGDEYVALRKFACGRVMSNRGPAHMVGP